MTDTLLDPNDTGEIPRPIGEDTVRIVGETRARIDTGEATQRIDPRLIKAPSFDAVPRKVFDMDDTVVYHRDAVVYDQTPTIGIVRSLDDKPHPKPPPLPKPPTSYDMAAAQPVSPWERIAATEPISLLGSVAGLDGELREAPPAQRRSVPYVIPADARRWSGPRHAKPAPLWARASLLVCGAMAAGAAVALVVLAVFW